MLVDKLSKLLLTSLTSAILTPVVRACLFQHVLTLETTAVKCGRLGSVETLWLVQAAESRATRVLQIQLNVRSGSENTFVEALDLKMQLHFQD